MRAPPDTGASDGRATLCNAPEGLRNYNEQVVGEREQSLRRVLAPSWEIALVLFRCLARARPGALARETLHDTINRIEGRRVLGEGSVFFRFACFHCMQSMQVQFASKG